jgi:type II secretory pathway pseudopilin PulG
MVELIIVVTVIIIVLAIAIPGLSAMSAEARLTAAQQMIQGVTTQAYYLGLANRSMTAVRFCPGPWDADPNAPVADTRQRLAIYNYVGTSAQEGSGGWSIAFGEYFERAKDLSSVAMPEDVWAAPLEALQVPAGQFWLTGPLCTTPSTFTFDPNVPGANFLNADDFLIVCDPETGVRTGTPTPFRLRAFAPTLGYEVDNNAGVPFQRYSFSGVVTYRREPFAALGASATGAARQALLQRDGRPFMVQRYSGGLQSGLQRPPGP